jgi:UDP-N-acetylglucosamine--dolichyl-phosphate N-acetylglucosaminephosphotransferase
MIFLVIFGIISFIVTFITSPLWIKRAKETGITGKDVHKQNREVAEIGGITVILGAIISLMIYVAIDTFIFKRDSLVFLLAATGSILIATMIGMTDDMLGWRIGLRQKEKVLLTLVVPIPMMVVNSGHSMMKFPIFGQVELGILYPLLILPIGIIGATNGFNMLAGFNGLESSMGIILLSTLGLIAWKVGAVSAVVVSICFIFALLAFLYYNKYPSKVFPGDVMTYPLGATIAIIAILADIERFALILFFPYYIELILKARGKFEPEWTGEVLKDGTLSVRDKIFSVPHLAILLLRKVKGSAKENEVVIIILGFEAIIAVITILSFKNWI